MPLILLRLHLIILNFVNWPLRKGKHVFVEKPLANTMEEAKTLVKLAKESNIKFQVGHVERFNPAFLSLKDYVLATHVY